MSTVNRKNISGPNYQLDDASEYTQLIRWSRESIIKPAPVHSTISIPVSVNLLSIAQLVLSEQLSVPLVITECATTTLYGGGVYTIDFNITLDGENATFAGEFILEDGGTPASIFC